MSNSVVVKASVANLSSKIQELSTLKGTLDTNLSTCNNASLMRIDTVNSTLRDFDYYKFDEELGRKVYSEYWQEGYTRYTDYDFTSQAANYNSAILSLRAEISNISKAITRIGKVLSALETIKSAIDTFEKYDISTTLGDAEFRFLDSEMGNLNQYILGVLNGTVGVGSSILSNSMYDYLFEGITEEELQQILLNNKNSYDDDVDKDGILDILEQIEDIKKKAPVYSSSKVAQTYYTILTDEKNYEALTKDMTEEEKEIINGFMDFMENEKVYIVPEIDDNRGPGKGSPIEDLPEFADDISSDLAAGAVGIGSLGMIVGSGNYTSIFDYILEKDNTDDRNSKGNSETNKNEEDIRDEKEAFEDDRKEACLEENINIGSFVGGAVPSIIAGMNGIFEGSSILEENVKIDQDGNPVFEQSNKVPHLNHKGNGENYEVALDDGSSSGGPSQTVPEQPPAEEPSDHHASPNNDLALSKGSTASSQQSPNQQGLGKSESSFANKVAEVVGSRVESTVQIAKDAVSQTNKEEVSAPTPEKTPEPGKPEVELPALKEKDATHQIKVDIPSKEDDMAGSAVDTITEGNKTTVGAIAGAAGIGATSGAISNPKPVTAPSAPGGSSVPNVPTTDVSTPTAPSQPQTGNMANNSAMTNQTSAALDNAVADSSSRPNTTNTVNNTTNNTTGTNTHSANKTPTTNENSGSRTGATGSKSGAPQNAIDEDNDTSTSKSNNKKDTPETTETKHNDVDGNEAETGTVGGTAATAIRDLEEQYKKEVRIATGVTASSVLMAAIIKSLKFINILAFILVLILIAALYSTYRVKRKKRLDKEIKELIEKYKIIEIKKEDEDDSKTETTMEKVEEIEEIDEEVEETEEIEESDELPEFSSIDVRENVPEEITEEETEENTENSDENEDVSKK